MTAAAGLDALNEECRRLCTKYDRHNGWQGFGPKPNRTPNYRLLYSSAATFEDSGRVMFLGTNPGGNHKAARPHEHEWPFSKSSYSAYLDEAWGSWGHPGEQSCHPLQTAARQVASKIVGGRDTQDPGRDAADLLRRSPAGNLIPFRSETPEDLPPRLRERGLEIGWNLIELAKPRLLVLFASNRKQWEWLMQQMCRNGPEPRCQEHPIPPNFSLREARLEDSHELPAYIFALPALITRTWGNNSAVISCFEKRIDEIGRDRLLRPNG